MGVTFYPLPLSTAWPSARQRSMPPVRFATSLKAAFCRIAVERDQNRVLDVAERTGGLLGLAHVEDLHRGRVLLEPVWIDLPHAGEAVAERRPARIGG